MWFEQNGAMAPCDFCLNPAFPRTEDQLASRNVQHTHWYAGEGQGKCQKLADYSL